VIRNRARSTGLVVLILLLLVSTTVLAAPYGSRMLSSGTFGGDVVELQRRLLSLGYDAGKADGLFGGKTREALRRFQRDHGLISDGVAGRWTITAVDRAYTWQNGYDYKVTAGDSLWTIGGRSSAKLDGILWLNGLTDTMLYPGQILRLPGPAPRVTPQPAPAPKPAPAATPAPTPAPSETPKPKPSPDPTPAPTQPPDATATPKPTPDPSPVSEIPPSPNPPASSAGYTLLGYYAEDWVGDARGLSSLENALGQVDLLVNFQLQLNALGEVTTRDYPELMAQARTRGIKVQGLVHNLSGGIFDASIARAVLSDATVRSLAVANIVKAAKDRGLSGINLDVENVAPQLRTEYTALVRELSAKLRAEELSLTLSIPAKTTDDTTSPWSGAFDYKALGPLADWIVPMAYDEHLPGYSAGPVASATWVEQVTAFAASQVGPEKVLLGIPAYAYDWRKGSTDGYGLSVPEAMNLAVASKAVVQWDEAALVPYFAYIGSGQERVVYFENARSLEAKLAIVKRYGLSGIAIWRMGLEDPGIWSVIKQSLQ